MCKINLEYEEKVKSRRFGKKLHQILRLNEEKLLDELGMNPADVGCIPFGKEHIHS